MEREPRTAAQPSPRFRLLGDPEGFPLLHSLHPVQTCVVQLCVVCMRRSDRQSHRATRAWALKLDLRDDCQTSTGRPKIVSQVVYESLPPLHHSSLLPLGSQQTLFGSKRGKIIATNGA